MAVDENTPVVGKQADAEKADGDVELAESGSERETPSQRAKGAVGRRASDASVFEPGLFRTKEQAVGVLAHVAWVAAILFAIAAFALLILWFFVPGGDTATATFLVLSTAAFAYFAKANHLGYMDISGKKIPIVRYLDWITTTPLMLYELCHIGRADTNVTIIVIGCDLIMLAFGIVAATVDFEHPWLKHFWFLLSCLFYVLMLVALQVRVSESARTAPAQNLFTQLEWLMMVVWSFYPIVVGAGRAHLGLINKYTEDALLVVMDVVAKIGMEVFVVATCMQPNNGCHAAH